MYRKSELFDTQIIAEIKFLAPLHQSGFQRVCFQCDLKNNFIFFENHSLIHPPRDQSSRQCDLLKTYETRLARKLTFYEQLNCVLPSSSSSFFGRFRDLPGDGHLAAHHVWCLEGGLWSGAISHIDMIFMSLDVAESGLAGLG